MKAEAIAAALLAAALTACTFAPVDVEPRQAVLTQLPAEVPTAPTLAATLLVRQATANAPYDTTRMAYNEKPVEIGYYLHTEWADKPAAMVQGLIVRTLERTQRFRAVAMAPYAGATDYILDTRLVELRQDFTENPAVLRITVRAELRRASDPHPSPLPGERVIVSREFEAREPIAARTPYAGAVAANAAVARILADIARFVVEHTG
jgi:cholesterol transport system auxiliary component